MNRNLPSLKQFWNYFFLAWILLGLVLVVLHYAGFSLPEALQPFWIDSEISPPTSPSWRHPWGTDELGRDLLVRLLFGTGYSLLFGLEVAVVSSAVGMAVGLFLSFLPFPLQRLGSLSIDLVASLPFLPFALLVLLWYPGQIIALGLLKALLSWGTLAQAARLQSIKLQSSPMLLAGRSQGLSPFRLAIKYVLPALIPTLHGFWPLFIASSVLSLASLDLFGLGMPIPYPSLSETFRQFLEHTEAWWLMLFPLGVLASLIHYFMTPQTVDQPRFSRYGSLHGTQISNP